MPTDFVKSAGTRVSVEETQGHIISVLHRYGASGFGFRRVGDVIMVTFHIPGTDGVDRTVAIPLDIAKVRAKLNPKLASIAKNNRKGLDPMQVERVAWRIVLDWIDAALSAVSIGAQTVDEAFYAHTVVETVDGQRGRMIDYVTTIADSIKVGGKLPNPGSNFKQLSRGD